MSDPSDKAVAQAFRDYVADSGTVGGPMLKFITNRARELDAAKGGAWAALNGDAANGDATPPAQAAEAVEYRMWDSQWVNVVNHERAYSGWDMEEAINHAVKLTEKAMARNIADGNWPPARAAIAAIQAGE